MKPTITWYLIADGCRARIVSRNGPTGRFEFALDHDFIAPNIADHDLGTERAGHSRPAAGGVGHTYAPSADWRHEEKHKFARMLAETLEKSFYNKDFDNLVLVASAQVMGSLRRLLKPKVASVVIAELVKDLTHVPVHDLPDQIGKI